MDARQSGSEQGFSTTLTAFVVGSDSNPSSSPDSSSSGRGCNDQGPTTRVHDDESDERVRRPDESNDDESDDHESDDDESDDDESDDHESET